MKILITGITGRIGANLAKALLNEGHQVRGLVWKKDLRIEKLQGLGVELQYGSVTEPEDVGLAVDGAAAVYHLGAAFQGGGPFTAADYFEINVRGTFNVLEAARQEKGFRQFLFASTDAVYEKYVPGGMEEPIREDFIAVRPRGCYPLSKSLGEDLCKGYWRTYDTPITILRFCYVAGAGEILEFKPFYLAQAPDGRKQDEVRLVVLKDSNGRPYKKHIADVRDIVQGCQCALEKSEAIGEAFQLAGPRPFTWDEAVPHLSEVLDISYTEVISPEVPTFYEFDLSKSRDLLNFQPQYDIIRMIDDAVAFRNGEEIGVLRTD